MGASFVSRSFVQGIVSLPPLCTRPLFMSSSAAEPAFLNNESCLKRNAETRREGLSSLKIKVNIRLRVRRVGNRARARSRVVQA